MRKREIFRLLKLKTNKLVLMLSLIFSVIGFSFFATNQVEAASDIEIIQNRDDLSANLKPFIYIGEKMDWDVMLDGSAYGGMADTGFTWTSSNNSIVSIEDGTNGLGMLVAHAKGTAVITVRYQDGRTASASIRIKQPAKSVSLSKSATVYVGKPVRLSATINPSNTDDKGNGVSWKSSNTAIATVDSTGKVTARRNGTVTISATFTNNNRFTESTSPVPKTVSANPIITVRTKVTGVKLNRKNLALKRKASNKFTAIISPSTASNKSVSWATSNAKIFSVSGGKIVGKKQGYAYIRVTSVDGKKSAYAPVTVYDSVGKTVAYTKKKLNLRNGAHNTHKYVSTVRKLKKDAKVTIYGKSGNFFYIKYGSTYGFVLKKDLIYMSISAPRVTVNKLVRKYPTVKVIVHNSTAGLNWTQENRVVTFKLKKKSTKTKKYKDDTTITVRTYYVIPRKEGRANTKVRLRKASASYYVSSYTNTKDVEGFIRVKTSKMYKGANASLPVRKTLKKYNKVIILGKCTKGWFYVRNGNYKGFVKVSDVVYIKATDSLSMYRYNNKNFNAYLVNSYDDRRIKYSSNNNKIAKVSKQVNLSNGKRAQVWAEKNGKVTLTAYYEYTKGKTIKRKMKLSVKKVKLEIYSVKSNNVGQTMQVSARIRNVTSPRPVIKFNSSNSSLFAKKSEKGNVGKFAVYGIGTGTITVKYRGLKATKKVTTKSLLIYATQLRPGKSKNDGKASDLLYANKNSKQIISMSYISKKDYDPAYKRKNYIHNWKNLGGVFTAFGLQSVGNSMVNHFADGSGTTYTHPSLTTAAKNHSNTKKFINGVNKSFGTVIKKYNGNVSRLKYTHTTGPAKRKNKYPLIYQMSEKNGVGSIEFNKFEDNLNGLRFTIHQVYANQVEVVYYNLNSKTGKYTVKLKHTLYDHFGLDDLDIEKFGWMAGFRSWYILQHDKKFKKKNKPFITKIEFYVTLSGNI